MRRIASCLLLVAWLRGFHCGLLGSDVLPLPVTPVINRVVQRLPQAVRTDKAPIRPPPQLLQLPHTLTPVVANTLKPVLPHTLTPVVANTLKPVLPKALTPVVASTLKAADAVAAPVIDSVAPRYNAADRWSPTRAPVGFESVSDSTMNSSENIGVNGSGTIGNELISRPIALSEENRFTDNDSSRNSTARNGVLSQPVKTLDALKLTLTRLTSKQQPVKANENAVEEANVQRAHNVTRKSTITAVGAIGVAVLAAIVLCVIYVRNQRESTEKETEKTFARDTVDSQSTTHSESRYSTIVITNGDGICIL
ncbi:unnamed protein product [Albugo candida]|uniref:Uncharacterized protein n=1 Tax=Albugo candida TaxID=65357 RepID=A0A024FW76_9STRA|nr:unnamed protein product [Albugo candida]|eukprot:CCI11408.1 unnamed protein product [Albugo candida]